MHNSQGFTNRDFAIRKGAMRQLCSEGTGSAIDEVMSDPYQGAPRLWRLLNPADPSLWENHSATTGACLIIIKNAIDPPGSVWSIELNVETRKALAIHSPASVLNQVRTVFGLNITETAEVFGITRQTVYHWMKLIDMDQVRAHENRDRLKQLNNAVQLWQNYPPLKGRWLHAFLPNSSTVLDLLKAAQVNLNDLQAAYKALSASTADRRREEGNRATQAVPKLAGAFAGLGGGRRIPKE